MIKMKQQKRYHAREGSPFKEKYAQTVGVFIESCKDKTTKGILKEIRKNPNHIINSLIEWDDKKASELYRLQQVRNIVNHIEIEIVGLDNKTPIRAFYSINNGEESYKGFNEVFSNMSYRNQVIERAKIELDNWVERYHIYNELKKMSRLIKKEIKTIIIQK